MTDQQSADWEEWADRVSAELWEAVALSIDIEPKTLEGLDFRPIVGGPFDACPREFKRRLRVTQDHAENGRLHFTSYVGADSTRHRIKLMDFAEWALSMGWSLPKEFPRNQAATASTAKAENECKAWLVTLMQNDSSPAQNKSAYQSDAEKKFDIGTRAFIRAWGNAVAETGNNKWSKPGRKS